jgi:hypothetical protein
VTAPKRRLWWTGRRSSTFVLSGSDRFKVFRIDTKLVAAEVIHFIPAGDRAVDVLV